jgi:RDD family/GYF domain 2
MAELWYYAGPNNQPLGPVPREQLLSMIGAGQMGPVTLVWRNGMAAWAAASSQPELAAAFSGPPVMPPVMPQPARPAAQPYPQYAPQAGAAYGAAPSAAAMAPASVGDPEALTTVHPWRRFFAKALDSVLFTIVAAFAFAQTGLGFEMSVGFEYQAGNTDWIRQTVLSIVNLALFSIYDASLVAAMGTSPFRWLYGIHVLKQDGTKPDFGTSLMRSFKRMVFGFGLGIPLVSLITVIIQYFQLKNNGISSWDRSSGTVSRHYRIGGGKVVALVLIWLALLAGLAFISLAIIGVVAQMATQGVGK